MGGMPACSELSILSPPALVRYGSHNALYAIPARQLVVRLARRAKPSSFNPVADLSLDPEDAPLRGAI